MCQASEFSKHVITCEDVVRSGLVKQSFIDEMRNQLPFERFQREFMSEFVEDIDAWLTQSLIVSCIDSQLAFYDFQAQPMASFIWVLILARNMTFSVVVGN